MLIFCNFNIGYIFCWYLSRFSVNAECSFYFLFLFLDLFIFKQNSLIKIIILENKIDHRKLFSDNKALKIVNSPLKINVQYILDSIRSGFVYGAVTIETYQETLGIDPEQELQRMRKEWDNGLRDIYYPHVIQNTEKDQDTNISSPPLTKKQLEKQKEKEKASKPLMAKCANCGHEFDYLSVSESGMGYVKCPKCEKSVTQIDLVIAPYDKSNPPEFLKKYPKGAQEVFITVFNKSLPKGEDYAFPVAWTALKRWLKKNGYVKKDDKWIKKSDLEQEELTAKKHKLLDKLLGEKKDENI